MESEIHETHINSELFDKKKFQEQLDIIKRASNMAQNKIDYFSAHDDNIVRAIDIVEEFLRKTHRLCYGGQAINAHLPAKYKFYDPEYTIPDYDFFTPSQYKDINTLVKDLRKAGFTEIYAKEGMHEGTVKIYVDFIPIADITGIEPKLYNILSKREFRLDGISYLDANTLRMLMYLELSRPRGEVSRWAKVFERLSLFNAFVPSKPCRISRQAFQGGLNSEQVKYTLNYIIDNKRVFAGADLLQFYRHSLKGRKPNTSWILTSKKPIIFFSPEADLDAKQIRAEFNFIKSKLTGKRNENAVNNNQLTEEVVKSEKSIPITIRTVSSHGIDLIPSMKIVVQGNKSLVFIIDQTACHSYFNVPTGDGKIMRIASMDTLITLYFSLGLIDSSYFDMGSMECLANELVGTSIKARENPKEFAFPFISIKCIGHQTSLPSLIRSKVKRITAKKQQLKDILGDNIVNKTQLRKSIKNTKKSVRKNNLQV